MLGDKQCSILTCSLAVPTSCYGITHAAERPQAATLPLIYDYSGICRRDRLADEPVAVESHSTGLVDPLAGYSGTLCLIISDMADLCQMA